MEKNQDKLLDISISSNFPNDKRRIGRRHKTGRVYEDQWPRIYGKTIAKTVKAKYWEIRNYSPAVEQL